MSRSSQDVFGDIEEQARLAKEESAMAGYYLAKSHIEAIESYLREVKKCLEYEIKCKREADRQIVYIRAQR